MFPRLCLLLSLLLSGVFAAGADGTWSNPAAVTTATLSSTSGSADLTWSGSAFAVGQQLRLTGTVPGGFNANTNYFVVAASGSTIQLSRTWGGAAVSATSSITNGTAQAYQSWQTTANWSAGVPADGVDAVATFTNSPSASVAGVTLDGNVTLGKLVYTNTANSADMALISGNSASHTLTWATSGTVAGLEVPMLEVPAATNRLLNLGQTGVLKFAGTQGLIVRSSASGPLTGLGLGATQVAPAKNLRITAIDWSSFSGGLVIQRGVLQLQAANQLPGQSVTLGDLFSADNNQIVELTSTTAQTVGALHGNAWGRISGAFTLTVGGNNATGGDFGGVFGQTTPGVATAVTNLVKTGTGTQVFSGALKGGGSVTVNSGLLVIDGTHVPGATTGAAGKYTVNAGGALGGRGTIKPLDTLGGLAGAIDLKSGAVLAPGNPAIASGIGALTLDQSTALSPVLNFSAGATATFDLGGLANDQVLVVGAAGIASEVVFANTVLNFNDVTHGGLSTGQYVLFSGDANTGFAGLTLDGGGFITAGLTIGSGLGGYPGATLQVVGPQIVVNLVAPVSPPPLAPTNVTVTSSFGGVTLTWSAPAAAASYNVKRGLNPGGPFTQIATAVTEPTFVDVTAPIGGTFYYVVTAVNSNGEGSASSAVSATVQGVGIGVNLRAIGTAGMTSADVAGVARLGRWNNLDGPVANSNASLSAVMDSNGAAIGGLTVTLAAGAGGGGITMASADTGNDATMIRSVVDLYNGTASTLTVSGIPYATYDLYLYMWDDGAGRAGSFTVNGTTYYLRGGVGLPNRNGEGYVRGSDTTLGAGTDIEQGNYLRVAGLAGATQTITLSAVAAGDAAQRNKFAGFQIVATTAPAAVTSAPAAPAGVSVVAGNQSNTLHWNATTSATGYTIKRATTPGGPYTVLAAVDATANRFVDDAVTNGANYYYVVTATNAFGESAASLEGTGQPFDPAQVTVISVNLRSVSSFGMGVSDVAGAPRVGYWNNVVGPVVAGDTVSRAELTDQRGLPVAGVTMAFTAGTTTTGVYDVSGTLKPGTEVTGGNETNLFATVFDQYDGTPASLTVSGLPFASYDVVFYLYNDGIGRGGSITLGDTTYYVRGGVPTPTSSGVGYVVSTGTTLASAASANLVRFRGVTGSSFTASLVAQSFGDNLRRLKVAGFQIVSNDPYVAPTTSPAAPTTLTASGGNQQVALNWSHAAQATAYRVYRDGTQIAEVPVPLNALADSAVVNGTSYTYTVTAVNAAGESAPSASASATPAAPTFVPKVDSVFQFSVPVAPIFSTREANPERRAYLWVPPASAKLQGLVVAVQNMLEKPMFDDPAIRQACAEANLGLVLIDAGTSQYPFTPNGVGNYTVGAANMALGLDPNVYTTLDINPVTGVAFTSASEQCGAELAVVLQNLADESGYAEIAHAPLMLTGHSAASTFVWVRSVATSAALNGRVFALLPYKGTFPGTVPANIPALHVSSEVQEISDWGNTWERSDQVTARRLRGATADGTGNDRLLGEYVQPGTGHYQYSESLSGPLAQFIKSSAALRIPANWPAGAFPTLNPMPASSGYLVDVTAVGRGDAAPVAYADWVAAGKDPRRAFWYIDQATAQAVCDGMNAGFSRRPHVITAYNNATTLVPLATQSAGYGSLSATLESDGVTFKVRTAALTQSPTWRYLHGQPVGLASGPILLKTNGSGGLRQTGPDTFRVWMTRHGGVPRLGQPWEPFLIARHPGDDTYRESDRPIWLNTSVPVNQVVGATQTISFPAIATQIAPNLAPITLGATASSGLPVQYWVVSGPYHCDPEDNTRLLPDTLPIGAKYPLRVVVGAWQWGAKNGTAYQSAAPVYQTFYVTNPDGAIIVDSIEALRAQSGVSDRTVKLVPGEYWMGKNGTNPVFLDLSGSNATFDFTGVTIKVDSANLRGFGGADNSRIVRLLQISGQNITVQGLTLSTEIVGTEYTADRSTNSIEIIGNGAVLKNCVVTTRGSFPYGPGDAFGKGGNPNADPANPTLPFRSHRKHSGIRVGRLLGSTSGTGASNVTLDHVTINMRSYGHGIYFQEGASDIVVRDCRVLGDVMSDSSVVLEDPLYQQFGYATYGTAVPAGIKISKHEDGIRVYGADSNDPSTYGAVTNVTITGTVVERMRDAYAMGDLAGTLTITNSESWGCEQGFTPGRAPALSSITGSKGDAINGPLVFFRRSATGAVVSVELAGTAAANGPWPIALISGENNQVTLTRTAAAALYGPEAHVMVSQAWREWRHRPATDIDALGTANVSSATTGNVIVNQTGQLLVAGPNATANTFTTDGGILNKGSGNTVVGTTIVAAPITVTDTWGTYSLYSGLLTAADLLALGGTNLTDAGTLVRDGGTLEIGSGLSFQGEPLTLAGAGTSGQGALVSAGAVANNTRFNSTTGNLTLTGDTTVNVTVEGNQFLVGPVAGTGNLTKIGPGELVLEGNANTFTGSLTLAAGRITARGNKARHDLTIAAGTIFRGQASAAINQGATHHTVLDGTVVVNSRNDATNHTMTFGQLSGSGVITSTGTGANRVVVTGTAGESQFTGVIENNVGLTVNAPGATLALTGAHTYTGTTLVSAGTLAVQGALPSANELSVAAGATLTGGGSVGVVDLAAEATLAPGVGVGQFTASAVTLHGGSRLAVQVRDASGTAGQATGWDLLTVNGALALAADATGATPVVLALSGVSLDGAAGVVNNFNAATGYTWRVATAASFGGTFTGTEMVLDVTGFTAANPASGIFSLAVEGTDLVIRYQPAQTANPLASWRMTHFGTAENAGNAANTADPDGDGLSNLLEYALNADPLVGQAGPSVEIVTTAEGSFVALTFNRIADPALAYAVEATANLVAGNWLQVWSSTGSANVAGPVTANDTTPLSPTAPARFLRLRVTRE